MTRKSLGRARGHESLNEISEDTYAILEAKKGKAVAHHPSLDSSYVSSVIQSSPVESAAPQCSMQSHQHFLC